jgi:hypothetical protein
VSPCGVKANVRTMMRELDCGCGCHLEGKDELCLTIKLFLHLEAAHPEIEEPTIELAEEMVVTKAYEKRIRSTRSPRLFS